MRDRLAAVGGAVTITSVLGEGTVVAGSVPAATDRLTVRSAEQLGLLGGELVVRQNALLVELGQLLQLLDRVGGRSGRRRARARGSS